MAGSQMVSPMNSSSKPETATMSPTRALSQGHALEPVELVQSAQPRRRGGKARAVGAADGHLPAWYAAALNAPDADAAHVVVVVDGGNEQLQRRVRVALRRGDVGEDGVKQRPQNHARHFPVGRGRAVAAGGEDDGAVELFVGGVQLQKAVPASRPPPRRSARRGGRSC